MCISVYNMFVAVCMRTAISLCEFKQCTIVVDLVDIRVNLPVVLKKASYHNILSFLIEQNVTAPWINIS